MKGQKKAHVVLHFLHDAVDANEDPISISAERCGGGSKTAAVGLRCPDLDHDVLAWHLGRSADVGGEVWGSIRHRSRPQNLKMLTRCRGASWSHRYHQHQ